MAMADCNQEQFYSDVLLGLTSTPKYLDSKYFYDSIGDELFQQIMQSNEYYLSKCELDIFLNQTEDLCRLITNDNSSFNLIELGSGDASKSIHMLNYLTKQNIDFNYVPIDISSNIISYLLKTLPLTLPSLSVKGFNGEYFDMLKQVTNIFTQQRKVILFLGSNIGNMENDELFCKTLHEHLSTGDIVIIGFDLQKNPKTILDSYNHANGLSKKFVMNLFERINRELNGNFDTTKFDYYPTYDPEMGLSKGYLISLVKQQVHIGQESKAISFEENEYIYTGVSFKYTIHRIHELASKTNFKILKDFYDSKRWFVNSVWMAE